MRANALTGLRGRGLVDYLNGSSTILMATIFPERKYSILLGAILILFKSSQVKYTLLRQKQIHVSRPHMGDMASEKCINSKA